MVGYLNIKIRSILIIVITYICILDAPYILVDKNTKEIFFVYLKADKLELLLENYQTKSDHIANKTLIYCKNN